MENKLVGGNYFRYSENVLSIFKSFYILMSLFSLVIVITSNLSKCMASLFLVAVSLSVLNFMLNNRGKLFFDTVD